MAKILIGIGATLLAVGVLLHFYPAAFHWFGRLPGDIRIEREHGVFYFPITSMIIISIILSIALNLFFRRW